MANAILMTRFILTSYFLSNNYILILDIITSYPKFRFLYHSTIPCCFLKQLIFPIYRRRSLSTLLIIKRDQTLRIFHVPVPLCLLFSCSFIPRALFRSDWSSQLHWPHSPQRPRWQAFENIDTISPMDLRQTGWLVGSCFALKFHRMFQYIDPGWEAYIERKGIFNQVTLRRWYPHTAPYRCPGRFSLGLNSRQIRIDNGSKVNNSRVIDQFPPCHLPYPPPLGHSTINGGGDTGEVWCIGWQHLLVAALLMRFMTL